MFGSKGDTGLQKLDDSKNNFERDKLDTFFIKAADIGEQLTSCKVRALGLFQGWAWQAMLLVHGNTPKLGVS